METVKDDAGVTGPRMDVVCEHSLASDEDAPMTIAVTSKVPTNDNDNAF